MGCVPLALPVFHAAGEHWQSQWHTSKDTMHRYHAPAPVRNAPAPVRKIIGESAFTNPCARPCENFVLAAGVFPPERTVFGRSFLPERTFAVRRTAMGRTSAPRRRVAVLSTATRRWSRRGREVLLGKQDLLKSATAHKRPSNSAAA